MKNRGGEEYWRVKIELIHCVNRREGGLRFRGQKGLAAKIFTTSLQSGPFAQVCRLLISLCYLELVNIDKIYVIRWNQNRVLHICLKAAQHNPCLFAHSP